MAVYFIQAGGNGPVKIGRTEDPENRLRYLQTAHYEELQIIRVIDGGAETEAWLHRHYSRWRVRGEWFDYQDSMETISPPEESPPEPCYGSPTLTEFLNSGRISRGDFAKRVGVSVEAVRLWERGERFPRRDKIAEIEKATGGDVTVSDLYEHSPKPDRAA